MIATGDLSSALLYIDPLCETRGIDVLNVGKEIRRLNGTEWHFVGYAQNRGLTDAEAHSMWQRIVADPSGPDVIESMLNGTDWEPWRQPTKWEALLERERHDYVTSHVIAPPRASWGLQRMDERIGGIPAGVMTCIGGEAGTGKTAFAINVAYMAARTGRYRPLYLSAEISKHEVIDRMLAIHSRVEKLSPSMWADAHRIVEKRLGVGETWRMWNMPRIEQRQAVESYVESHGVDDPNIVAWHDFERKYGSSIAIVDDCASCDEISSLVRELTRDGTRVLPIIDHMHAIEPPEGVAVDNSSKEYSQVSAVSACLRNLAKECRCPMLVISELRNIGKKERDVPQLEWFRGSGRIAYDIGVGIIFMSASDATPDGRRVEAWVVKNRYGPKPARPIDMTFDGKSQLFYA